jgi:hypothetical protein
MARPVRIDRCICFDQPFAEIRSAIRTDPAPFGCDESGRAGPGDAGLESALTQVARRFGCGSCCGVCRPYLERMLETGETVFHEVLLPGERQKA